MSESVRTSENGFAPTAGFRLIALVEVIFAFATVHVCIKAVKQLTAVGAQERAAGFNFTPGLMMAAAAILWISLRAGSWRSFGLGSLDSFYSTRSRKWLLPVLYLIPLAAFLYYRSAEPLAAALVFLGHVAVTAVGEELFFRGYIQSRLNWAFGRPWRLGEVSVGAGLFLSAALFALLHALNTVDYFRAQFDFAWGWAGATLVVGLIFGLVREKTGGVIPCIIAHGLWNVWFLSVLMVLR